MGETINQYAVWFLGMALVYTLLLIVIGRKAKKLAQDDVGYFSGNRNFGAWHVAVCITGLFSGSSFVAILELSYNYGLSAIWYGIAESLHVFIIAFFLLSSFREKLVVTISGLIGKKYGELASIISGLITAITFPMWSTATALAFASALHVFTGLSLHLSVIFTALLLFLYLRSGGMWALGYTQILNVIVSFIMFGVGFYALLIEPGLDGLANFVTTHPEYLSPDSIGLQKIIVWFATFIINTFLAQACFQMATACKTVEEGRKGLYIALILDIFFMIFGVLFGMAAVIKFPYLDKGLVAFPLYLKSVLPPPLVGIFGLGIWACALGWGAPCQFSGATSLGKDVLGKLSSNDDNMTDIRYTKISLLVLTLLMICYSLLRSEASAWWNVFAWVVRNSATFSPVIAALFWPVATKRGVIYAMITGFLSGIMWNYLGGWDIIHFYLNIHPIWIGMSVNIIFLVCISLWDNFSNIKFKLKKKKTILLFILGFVGLLTLGVNHWYMLYIKGLLGLVSFSLIFISFILVILTTEINLKV
ncbi:sodium:solute symporter family protein [Selenihalanaerobacter shriftii]|uniref:sodium:solute symporter family protein n=1 Tax=Selenihalanaerobacter shriftii TaxID=142842 RepID=UPI00190EA93D|nr:sodium:solute symporter family protein [Selenihalanaerobacter shriftii]